jgi:hypothetical protein
MSISDPRYKDSLHTCVAWSNAQLVLLSMSKYRPSSSLLNSLTITDWLLPGSFTAVNWSSLYFLYAGSRVDVMLSLPVMLLIAASVVNSHSEPSYRATLKSKGLV